MEVMVFGWMTSWVGGWMRVGRVHTLTRLFASCCSAHSNTEDPQDYHRYWGLI